MSRLILKNLPGKITEQKLRQISSEYGTVTDVKLVYTKSKRFRRFGFVGFKDENEAARARDFLHNSLILNQKVVVEECKDFLKHTSTVTDSRKTHDADDSDTLKEDESKNSSESAVSVVTNLSDSQFLNLKKGDSATKPSASLGSSDNVENQYQEDDFMHNEFTIKIQGAPQNLSKKQITEFFYPTAISSLKLGKGKMRGAMVSFSLKKDFETALKLNGECIKGKSIKLTHAKKPSRYSGREDEMPWQERISADKDKINVEEVADSGRLFIRNLSYVCTEDDLQKLFGSYGTLSEMHMPIDGITKKPKGIAFVTFMFPEHAIKAMDATDGSVFQGRMLHVLPAKAKPDNPSPGESDATSTSSYKKNKEQSQKTSSNQTFNWNTLFIGTDAVAGAIAEKYNISKGEFLSSEDNESAAVRVALGETQIVQETRQFLIDNGISLDAFSQPNAERSKSIILCKNLPAGATAGELRTMFEEHDELGRVVLAPSGVTAVIEFLEPSKAKQAFVKWAYRRFHHKPLYLEWAPVNTFTSTYSAFKETKIKENIEKESEKEEPVEENADLGEGKTIFVKNINFETTEEKMKDHFGKCGMVDICTISKKKLHNKNELLSMGYGFVQYHIKGDADKALKVLQSTLLDDHKLKLKMSNRSTGATTANPRKKQVDKKQMSTKILVRNVPFQADRAEITSLFKTFGELKSVRLPKKLSVGERSGVHRGFAFVDFVTKQDAKKGFEALCHSTHLYGRRLVLEWADTEEDTVEGLRRKTAQRFHGKVKRFKGLEDFEKSLSSPVDKDA